MTIPTSSAPGSKLSPAVAWQRRHRDYAPHLAHVSAGCYWAVHVLIVGIALVGTAVDIPMIKPAIDVVVGQHELISWLVSALLMVVAGTTAIGIGVIHKAHEVQGSHVSTLFIALGGWTALGLALFGIRFLGAGYSDLTAIVEGAATSTGAGDQDRGMAALLLLAYAASGALCYWAGHSLNFTVQMLVRERRSLHKLESEFARAVGKLNHLTGIQLTKLRDVAAQPHSYYAANLSDAGVADLLHAHARKMIAIHLGDPAATGIVTIAPTTEPRAEAPDIQVPVAPTTHVTPTDS